MARRLPPLNALRAFEAAARHLSFTRAAEELYVTQAAISHHIKALEEHLGVTLFRRLNRRLALTDEGQRYLPTIREAFDAIALATESLAKGGTRATLTVSVMPSFGAKWLLPRLHRFREAQPEIDVRLSTELALTDFRRDGVDVAIRYGTGIYPHLAVTRLLAESYFPVCSPRVAEGLRGVEDLTHAVLLHDQQTNPAEQTNPDWARWLAAAGAGHVDSSRGPVFSDASLMVQSAVAGEGVAMGRATLVADDIAAGRLVRPFALALPSRWAYWIVCPKATAQLPTIAAFRAWLVAEAQRAEAGDGAPP